MNLSHDELLATCRAFSESNVQTVLRAFDHFGPKTRCHHLTSPSSPAPARFSDNGDGTVTDHTTGLMWSKENVGTGELNHAAAAQACKQLTLANCTDWRLPTRAELLTLVDDTRVRPAIDVTVFPSCKSGLYWADTAYAGDPSSCAWIVSFHNGYADDDDRNDEAFVRAVRAASQ